MPTSTVETAWNQSKIAIDHWKSLKLSKVTSAFSLNSHLDLLKNVLTHLDPGNDLTIVISDSTPVKTAYTIPRNLVIHTRTIALFCWSGIRVSFFSTAG